MMRHSVRLLREWFARLWHDCIVQDDPHEVAVAELFGEDRTPHRDGHEEIRLEGGSDAARVEVYLLACRVLDEVDAQTNGHRANGGR